MTQRVKVSVVVPVYGSEGCVDELVRRTTQVLTEAGRSFELVLVNDGSPDGSWEKIRQNAERNPAVRGINLRKNAGQDNAIMAGLRASRGDVVVIMDDDLQHDPQDIPRLVGQVEAGYDICYGRFSSKKQAFWKNFGSWLNDKLANIVVGKPRAVYLSPYKALSGEVAREITLYDGPFPYIDGLLFRVTAHVTQVTVEHHHRHAGRSNFSLVKSVGVWMRVATLFSIVPLRLASVLGFVFALVGLCMAVVFSIHKLLFPYEAMGWASTIVTILILGGIQLACLGVIGEYVGRVFLHLNRRPQYSIRETIPPN